MNESKWKSILILFFLTYDLTFNTSDSGFDNGGHANGLT